jgi:hypothetical protein
MGKTRKSRRSVTNVLANTYRTQDQNALSTYTTMKSASKPSTELVKKSTKTNTSVDVKLAFDYEPSYSAESLEKASVELLFHYLRFHVFPSLEESKKKQLFYKLAFVQCKEPTIFKQILELAKRKDYEGMLAITNKKTISVDTIIQVAKHELEWIDKDLASKLEVKPIRTVETLIDTWFLEDNPYLAYSLFQHILFTAINDEEIQFFGKFYESQPPEIRKELVKYKTHGTYTL